MTKIMHHTQAGGRGVKIPKSSYNEGHDAGTIADVLTDHNLAAHTTLGLAVENSANATTLDGIDSTGFVKVVDHTKTAHDTLNIDADTLDDKHKTAFASAAHSHTGLLKQSLILLWDKTDGAVPEGYMEISELTGTNFTVIKYVGGETELTNATHSVKIIADSDITVLVKDYQGVTIISASNETLYASIVTPVDKPLTINVANASGSPVSYIITANDPENNDNSAVITVTVAAANNQNAIFTLPKSTNITIVSA